MAIWFETAVRYEKVMENGAVKKVTEKNLFDALSFTEAEARTIEELTPFIGGDFSVSAAKKTKISEVFNIGADRYWLVCVAFVTIDEKTAQEKREAVQILVGASDFDDAVAEFRDGMKGTVADYEIVSVSESAVMEVYPAKGGGA